MEQQPTGRRKTPRRPRAKHVPQRTCIACRQVAGKRQLVRIVRTPAGTVEIDLTGKKNGRGAYLHADAACWDVAFKRKALQHALKTEVTEQDREELQRFRASLDAGDEQPTPVQPSQS
ncbi:MAG: YlxR family protein [Chloroflexi bacterium]|nr:YlxR family protein [Chloroflexota bacterium]